MTDIAIYTLTSELHDEQAVDQATSQFLNALNVEHTFCGSDYADYGKHDLQLIFVRTGGTEGLFRRLLPQLRQQSRQPVYLLASSMSNSLAASMEILSYLHQQGVSGEILHGGAAYVAERVRLLALVEQARRKLRGVRLGIIGQPSDWLISSDTDAATVMQKTGIELVSIPISELVDRVSALFPSLSPQAALGQPGAEVIEQALRDMVAAHRLQGFTLRCFDLLSAVRNTGCLALARLNADGVVAGCEGDVPAMMSMAMAASLTGMSGFQANPARIDPERGELLFAHCTIPLNMVERYELLTHFESGIGIGIRGFMAEGPVTIFKVSADLGRFFVADGELLRCQGEPGLCRTQMVVRLPQAEQARYFLRQPIGNHHIILRGHWSESLSQLMAAFGGKPTVPMS